MTTEPTSKLLALVDAAREKSWAEYCRGRAQEALALLEWRQDARDDPHDRYFRAAEMVGLGKYIAYRPMFWLHHEARQRALLALNGKPWPSSGGGGNGTGPVNA